MAADIIQREAKWLAENAVNNRMPPPQSLFEPNTLREYRQQTTEQKKHAGRIQPAFVLHGYALEEANWDVARDVLLRP